MPNRLHQIPIRRLPSAGSGPTRGKVQPLLLSYCITSIVSRICQLLQPDLLLTCCQLVDSLVNLAELESLQLINSKFLPLLLEYLLPIDSRARQLLPRVRYSLPEATRSKVADYYHRWHLKTQLTPLPTPLYQHSAHLVNALQPANTLDYHKELQEYSHSHTASPTSSEK